MHPYQKICACSTLYKTAKNISWKGFPAGRAKDTNRKIRKAVIIITFTSMEVWSIPNFVPAAQT